MERVRMNVKNKETGEVEIIWSNRFNPDLHESLESPIECSDEPAPESEGETEEKKAPKKRARKSAKKSEEVLPESEESEAADA